MNQPILIHVAPIKKRFTKAPIKKIFRKLPITRVFRKPPRK